MQLLPEITFSIDADEYVTLNPVTKEIVHREPFGAEFAGEISLKPPTIAQAFEIPCLVTAAIQRFEVRDLSGLPAETYELIAALAWFQVLATKRPAWLNEGVASSPKGIAAIVHAHRNAEAKLAEAKKNSAAAGSPS